MEMYNSTKWSPRFLEWWAPEQWRQADDPRLPRHGGFDEEKAKLHGRHALIISSASTCLSFTKGQWLGHHFFTSEIRSLFAAHVLEQGNLFLFLDFSIFLFGIISGAVQLLSSCVPFVAFGVLVTIHLQHCDFFYESCGLSGPCGNHSNIAVPRVA